MRTKDDDREEFTSQGGRTGEGGPPGLLRVCEPQGTEAVREELSPERKTELEAESKRKITFMEREYWKLRNGEQEYMRCPYCAIASTSDKREREFRINYVGQPMCCPLFAKMFGAILDRQIEVDAAAGHVRNCHKVGLVN